MVDYHRLLGLSRSMAAAIESAAQQTEAARAAFSAGEALGEHVRTSAALAADLQTRLSATQGFQDSAWRAIEQYQGSSAYQVAKLLEVDSLFRSQLAQAVGPLPLLTRLEDQAALAYRAIESTMDVINRAIGESTFLWATDLPEHSADSEAADDEPPSGKLIEVVPADALHRLKSVDLLPLRVLDRIYMSPTEMYRLSPRQFEEFVAEILDGLGFAEILLTPRRGDRGRDIVAVKRVEGIPVVFAFECKRYSATRKIGVGICRSLLGTISQSASTANVGVLVTTSTFTKGASEFFLTEASVKGRDFNGVVDWIEDVKLKQRARSARKSGLVLPGFLTDKVLTSDFED